MTKILEQSGYSATTTGNGQSAINLIKELRFDSVVVDMNLPGNIDGISIIEFLKKKSPDTNIIAMTDFKELYPELQVTTAGAHHYISKPFEIESILEVLQGDIRRHKISLEPGSPKVTKEKKEVTGTMPNKKLAKKFAWITPDFFINNNFYQKFSKMLPAFDLDYDRLLDQELRKQNIEVLCGAAPGAMEFNKKYSYGYDVMRQNPGDSRLTEYLYSLNPLTELDLFFMNNDSCKAMRQRFYTVEDQLYQNALKKFEEEERVKILSVGSGPGKDVINVMRRASIHIPLDKIEATLLDSDVAALKKGEIYAKDFPGIYERINFAEQSIRAPDIADDHNLTAVIGVLCPFSPTVCKSIISHTVDYMSPGGLAIVSNISTKNLVAEEGKFNRFIMEYVCNWFLGYKDKDGLTEVLKAGGLRDIKVGSEPVGYHLLAQGKK